MVGRNLVALLLKVLASCSPCRGRRSSVSLGDGLNLSGRVYEFPRTLSRSGNQNQVQHAYQPTKRQVYCSLPRLPNLLLESFSFLRVPELGCVSYTLKRLSVRMTLESRSNLCTLLIKEVQSIGYQASNMLAAINHTTTKRCYLKICE
jgi:hypothetical protein